MAINFYFCKAHDLDFIRCENMVVLCGLDNIGNKKYLKACDLINDNGICSEMVSAELFPDDDKFFIYDGVCNILSSKKGGEKVEK